MSTYGEIKKIQDEMWSHRFKVKTGVRLVDISLKKHIPSHIKVDGHRALIQYEGQPMTCYRCNEQGHQITECPRRKTPGSHQTSQEQNSWANKVKRGIEKAPSADNNYSNDIPQSSNGEARQVIELRARSIDEDPHNKQVPMTVDPHLCPPANEIMTPSKETNKTENIDRMNEDLSPATPDTQPTCPDVTKWSDLISTESDAERDHNKQGKKLEK